MRSQINFFYVKKKNKEKGFESITKFNTILTGKEKYGNLVVSEVPKFVVKLWTGLNAFSREMKAGGICFEKQLIHLP